MAVAWGSWEVTSVYAKTGFMMICTNKHPSQISELHTYGLMCQMNNNNHHCSMAIVEVNLR